VVVTHEHDIRSVVGREVTLQDGRVVDDARTRVPA
jgi:ABC-type lipoprotein export system ATPase subunit